MKHWLLDFFKRKLKDLQIRRCHFDIIKPDLWSLSYLEINRIIFNLFFPSANLSFIGIWIHTSMSPGKQKINYRQTILVYNTQILHCWFKIDYQRRQPFFALRASLCVRATFSSKRMKTVFWMSWYIGRSIFFPCMHESNQATISYFYPRY